MVPPATSRACTQRRSARSTVAVVAGAGVAALALIAAGPQALWCSPGGDPRGPSRRALLGGALASVAAPQSAMALTPEEKKAIQMFINSSPSVMGVTAQPARRDGEAPPISGSAFVWDTQHVVTNFHVIADLAQPYLTFEDPAAPAVPGKPKKHMTLAATIVGADPLSDIAVLQVNGIDADGSVKGMTPDGQVVPVAGPGLLRPLRRGTSARLMQGQEVYALGNPFGLESSMSRGVISGLQRTFPSSSGRPITGVIQTDTSVNPGNSGGPLLDSDGNVIGINAAILSRTGSFSGVSLAIPIDTVEKNVASMLEQGFVSRASLGIIFAPDELNKELGVEGAMVMKVYKGGPAWRAGVKAMRTGHFGDVVTKIDGNPVSGSDDIFKLLDAKAPGESVVVTVERPSVNPDTDTPDILEVPVALGASTPPPPKTVMVAIQ